MESPSNNEESHPSTEESQFINENNPSKVRKKPKKTSTVRFAPEASSIRNKYFVNGGVQEQGALSNEEIRTEICSCLPSNTLGRQRFRTLSKAPTKKASTFPRPSMTDSRDIPMTRLRHRSFVLKKKSSMLPSFGRPTEDFADVATEDEEMDELESLTEEERQQELLNIKNIPVRLSEKRKYRDAILQTFPRHGTEAKPLWTKFLSVYSCLKRFSSALEIWNGTLKRIEGQQGTGVVSYFVFLRWLIALNLILFILYLLLVTVPHSAFAFLPLKNINTAPNETVVDEAFLSQFPASKEIAFKSGSKSLNFSPNLSNSDIFSHLGSLFDDYLPDNIADVTLNFDKRNFTPSYRRSLSRFCGERYQKEMENKSSEVLNVMQDLLQGTGWLQSTVLFLGHYSPNEVWYLGLTYNLPVAVIFVLFLSFLICFCMMIQYSSHGVQEAILARKGNYLAYSNILFCSWDYCIVDKKSSIIRHNSIVQEIKSTLAEERRKREINMWSKSKKMRVYFLRCIVNIFVVGILCGCYYLIYRVVNYQLREQQLHRLQNPGVNTLFVQYLSPITITALNIFVPIIFTTIVKLEMYNTRTQINMALFRIVFLRLSSVFVLVGLLYQQITCIPKDKCLSGMNATCQSPLCWETYVGQQLYKLAITDFIVYILVFIAYDVPRDLIVRRFKNKLTDLVGRQSFDLPNQVLSLVYTQTLCWLGIMYSPLLPAITLIKLVTLFYIKKEMVLKYCIPAPIPYKASRSNAMFMMILMMSFFSLMIIHGYSISSIEPSPACSPFRHYFVMLEAIPDAVFSRSPTFASILKFFFSPIFLFPAILVMCLSIYYYWTIVVANRKMVKVLKAQIALEGRDKQFLLTRLTEVARGDI